MSFLVGEGEKVLETPELIKATYLTQWTPPKTFESTPIAKLSS